MTYEKPIPQPDLVSEPFFVGAREHRLLIQKCLSCGGYLPPGRQRCYLCLSTDIEWIESSGKGTVHSFCLVYQRFHPGFEPELPYNVALIELAEGVKITANVVGCSNDDLRCDMPVEVVYEDITDDVSIPRFKRAEVE